MQTLTRYDPPRNRASYEHTQGATITGTWDALNRAEYHIWRACRLNGGWSVDRGADREAHKARARYYLGLARRRREARQ